MASEWQKEEGTRFNPRRPHMDKRGRNASFRGTLPQEITEEKREQFKALLNEGWGPRYACSIAGIGEGVAMRRRKTDDAFRILWEAHSARAKKRK